MAFWNRWFAGDKQAAAPRASVQELGGGKLITNSKDLEEAIRGGTMTAAGVSVTPETALSNAAVYACVRIISGAVATLPIHIKRRVDDRTRADIADHHLWRLLRRRPNRWMKPAQFRRMMQAHLLLRGNAYSVKVRSSRGEVVELWPLHPDRVTPVQRDDMSIVYHWRRKDGRVTEFRQDEILHLMGMTLDGISGVSVIAHARETIGLGLATQRHGAAFFANGTTLGMVLKHPGQLGEEAIAHLKESLETYRGAENAHKTMILEEGTDLSQLAMTAEDAQFIETMKLTRTDISMFFGVPPHMLGDTEKSTSWGSGIEQQGIGFVTFTLEDWLTTWEEAINTDLVPAAETDVYARFNRAALVKGDIKSRWEAYVKGLQWGVYSPNEIRALEDANPRDGGDIYYPPPNTAGTASETGKKEGA